MKKKANIKELSATGGSASMQPGSGEGMATKYAFAGGNRDKTKKKKSLLVTKKLYKEYKKSAKNLEEIKKIKKSSIKETKESSFLYILEMLEKENITNIKNILNTIKNRK